MLRNLIKLPVVFLIFLFGCHIPAKLVMEDSGGRNAYNIALQVSNSEQMLLNLVRLRYFEHPFFLNVSNVTTQFTYRTGASASIPIPGFNKDNPFVLGGDISWQNQPTLQFTPLEGQEFARQLLSPIDLQTIQHLVYSGWDIDRVFRLVIQSFDELSNAPEASGPLIHSVPKYKAFFEATRLLRHFQIQGQLRMGVHIESKKNGEKVQHLQIAFPYEGEEAAKLASMLKGVYASDGRYILNMELGFNIKGDIGVYPRSILSCLYYLSRNVVVPEEDEKSGKVGFTKLDEGTLFTWKDVVGDLIEVKAAAGRRPKTAYIAVNYRNCWFYIDDRDVVSKQTFLLLLELYNLQSTQAKLPPPVLTLPLGG